MFAEHYALQLTYILRGVCRSCRISVLVTLYEDRNDDLELTITKNVKVTLRLNCPRLSDLFNYPVKG